MDGSVSKKPTILQLPFPIYLSLISQFGKQISLLTAKIASCVITHSFGQANWSASVKQLCNKDDLERFSAKKTASLLRASFSNQISKNCLCYPSIFRTGFLRRLFHVGLGS